MEHLSEQDIERYRRRALAPPELLHVDAHLAGCDGCLRRVAEGRDPLDGLRNSVGVSGGGEQRPGTDHLSYEQVAALVDGTIDDVEREIAQVHLEVCRQCAEELADLRALNTAPSAVPRPVWSAWRRLATAGVVVVAVGMLARGVGWWRPSGEETTPGASASVPIDPSSARPQRFVASLKDGTGLVTLDEAGNVGGLEPLKDTAIAEAVRTALTTRKLNLAPAIEGLRPQTGALMGTPPERVPFGPTAPLGVVVRSDRPTFRWQPLAGADSYVVRIYDTTFKEVASSASQVGTVWTPATPLPRGAVYVWQVTATRSGEETKAPAPPSPEARFKVLGRDEAARLDGIEKSHAGSHLVLGTVYAEAGLLEEAEREFRLLLDANPDSQIVKELLGAVASVRSPR